MSRTLMLVVAAALSISTVAFAQGPTPEEAPALDNYKPAVSGDEKESADEAARPSPFFVTGIGVSIEAGGGFGGLLGSAVAVTSVAGVWTARIVVGTRRHFAYEAAYVGSALTVNTFGLERNARLIGQGAETAIRYNLLTGMWQPYASAGLGILHYSYGGAELTVADYDASGNVIEFPLAVGFAIRIKGFVFDTRFSFHPAMGWTLAPGVNMTSWDLAARAGIEF